MSNTHTGMSFSMQRESAVESMTSSRRFMRSRGSISSNFVASGCFRGSASYTPSTRYLAMSRTFACISAARSAAVVSVVMYGLPVPAAKMTTMPLSRWWSARRKMYGSATSWMSMAVMVRVSTPWRSNASWSASALMTVASIPA